MNVFNYSLDNEMITEMTYKGYLVSLLKLLMYKKQQISIFKANNDIIT